MPCGHVQVMQASYGPTFGGLIDAATAVPLTTATPNANGCSAYPRGTSLAGYAVLITRGNCSFAVKVISSLHQSLHGERRPNGWLVGQGLMSTILEEAGLNNIIHLEGCRALG